MKKLILFIAFLPSLVSCEKSGGDDILNDNLTLKDPINGISEYLIDSVTLRNSSVPTATTVKYAYNKDGILEVPNLVISPENLNNENAPYITQGSLKYYCDLKRRVFKTEDEYHIKVYDYDEKDRLIRSISTNKKYSFNDTTTYKYYSPGENNWAGTSYETKSPNYILNPDGTKTALFGSLYKTYYYSETSEKLKSWETLPYNYGKISEYPLVQYQYTTASGSLRTERFVHVFDERGLVTKTTHYYIGGISEQNYYYKKR